MEKLPPVSTLTLAVCTFLDEIGTQASNSEIDSAVSKALSIPADLLSDIHSGSRTVFQYKMAWARTNAKKMGRAVSLGNSMWRSSK
jgi:hypothetical protein